MPSCVMVNDGRFTWCGRKKLTRDEYVFVNATQFLAHVRSGELRRVCPSCAEVMIAAIKVAL